MKRRFLYGLVALAFGALLSGCQASSARDYSGYRAKLDEQASQIDLPLEEFAMSWKEQQLVSRANAVLVQRCMVLRGLEFPRAQMDWGSLPRIPDRRYGLWSRADAEQNGYELPPSPQSVAVDAAEQSLGSDWLNAATQCMATTKTLPVMGVNTSPDPSVVDRGMSESFSALLASDTFASQKAAWLRCVQSSGLSLGPRAQVLVPAFPPAGEAQFKVAAIDVECKQRLNTIQTLADEEAQRQLRYRDQHEGELVTYRQTVEKILARAGKVLGQ